MSGIREAMLFYVFPTCSREAAAGPHQSCRGNVRGPLTQLKGIDSYLKAVITLS